MVDFREGRAGQGRASKPLSEREQAEIAAREGMAQGMPGFKTLGEFFLPESQWRTITRGELASLLGTIAHAEKHSVWWRRAIRWLKSEKPVMDIMGQLAKAHERSLAKGRERAKEKADAVLNPPKTA